MFKKNKKIEVVQQQLPSYKKSQFEEASINAIKILGLEAINNANSGHPGIVLGAAPIMYSLFKNFITLDPKNPTFIGRDRFVMSAGHGSALLYSVMHLAGYRLSIQDLKDFRQISSKTAGHPENFLIQGIDATTGPLGQGVANAVGMAISEKYLNAKFQVGANSPIDNYTYCLFGDGCLQEGISYESFALAGRLKLNKLVMLFDSNDVQLDTMVDKTTAMNYKMYFESMGWNYLLVSDGASVRDITNAISKAKQSKSKPTIIEIKTIIGSGAKKQNTPDVHGSPLPKDEVKNLRNSWFPGSEAFTIPNEVYSDFSDINKRIIERQSNYDFALAKLKTESPGLYDEFINFYKNWTFPNSELLNVFQGVNADSTRNITGKVVDMLFKRHPFLIGGSADLSGSTKIKGSGGDFDSTNPIGRNINYGVREFAMQAINNGIASYGLLVPIGATFFNFSDYQKAAVRLACLSKLRTIQFYSHDSIFLGEDGPTHQPIEQLWSLRLIPNHITYRPANIAESITSIKSAISSQSTPHSIVTSRLAFEMIEPENYADASMGGYILRSNLHNSKGNVDLAVIATGSEVPIAYNSLQLIARLKPDLSWKLISMPSLEVFNSQSEQYRKDVLAAKMKVSIEAGSSFPWRVYVDYAYGIDEFGKSGPSDALRKHFKFTSEDFFNFLSDKINKK